MKKEDCVTNMYRTKLSLFAIILVLLISCAPVIEYKTPKSEVSESDIDEEKVCEEIVPAEVYAGSPVTRRIKWENDWTDDVLTGFKAAYIYPYHWFHRGQYSGENVNLLYSTKDFPAVKKIVKMDEQGNIRDVTWYWYNVKLVVEPEASRIETDPRFGIKLPYHKVVKATCVLHKTRKE